MKLDLYSEPYGPTGNIGDNFKRLLGTPNLGAIPTLLREALQNCADAAKLGTGPKILLRLRHLTESEKSTLKQTVLNSLPRSDNSRELMSGSLCKSDLVVLEICDFGTIGLAGPTRSDRIPIGTKHTDFIDFLRNIGAPRDTDLGGGTYGFGKAALYRASHCSTILVDSLVSDGNQLERRFMGCHFGKSYEHAEDGVLQRYTGRHWWGRADQGDEVADPLIDGEAAEIARQLGMPARDTEQSGTSIMILDFDTEGQEDLKKLGSQICEMVMWNFWPRLMESAPVHKKFDLKIEVEGSEIDIPAPESISPFDILCRAMTDVRQRLDGPSDQIFCAKPKKMLGNLSKHRALKTPRRPIALEDSIVPDPLHHIALLRPVELVVKYITGEPLPDTKLEWGGVFLTSDAEEVERAFADSEPPAHDDWVPDNLPKGHAKTYVNVALREVHKAASNLPELGDSSPAGLESSDSLAPISSLLGSMLMHSGRPTSGAQPSPKKRKRAKPANAKASPAIFKRLEVQADASRVMVFETTVLQNSAKSGIALMAQAHIAIDGSALRHSSYLSLPKVISIKNLSTLQEVTGGRFNLLGSEGNFEIRVTAAQNHAVIVDCSVSTEGAE
jgi:hypothetical protein